MTSIAALTLLTAVVLAPQVSTDDLVSRIDGIFGWVTPASPGCTIAAAQDGRSVVNRAYGLADLERKIPLEPDSMLDAASVVKQFVAAATLLLVEDGKLSLTDDVRRHVPELPDYGHVITLDHLLTHTSGIRDWTGLMRLTDGTADALALTLRQRGLNSIPGEEWSYSNSGYVLLKEVIARVSGMSFATFARTRLFEPLGMKKSAYVLDVRDVGKARALAYEKAGDGWTLDVHVGNERGGGGALFTTAGDLLLWARALEANRLGSFVTGKLHEPATLRNGRKLGYGRGLFLDTNDDGRVIWHTGGSAGYRTLLARFPDRKVAIAIMCNAGERADRTAYARRIYKMLVPATPAKADADEAPPPSPDGTDLKRRTGLFFNEDTGDALRIGVDSGRLRIQGGPVLLPAGPDRFRNARPVLSFMSGAAFDLRFVSPDRVELTTAEGETTVYRRGQPYTPAPAELQAFAGRYQSDEAGAFFDMVPAGTGLMGRANNASGPPLPFVAVDRDTFQLAGIILRFQRDAAGTVIGLEYSNPVVRNISFSRVRAGEAR